MATAEVEMKERQAEKMQARKLNAFPDKTKAAQEEQDMELGAARKFVLTSMASPRYEMFLGAVVVFNVVLLVIDTDSTRSCSEGISCTPQWVEVMDYILLAVYTVDVVCGIFAQRREYFKQKMNWLDFIIVGMGYFEIVAMLLFQGAGGGALSMIRMLRIARMLRLTKLLKPLPELYKLLSGFAHTLRAIFWGFVMLVLLLIVWSIIFLQVFAMLDTESVFQLDPFAGYWCEDATSSVAKMGLLLWQTLIAGDSWGACTLPIILQYPHTYLLFAAAFVVINIGFTNLILAVIVENAQASHEDEIVQRLVDRKEEMERDINTFREIFQGLDTDNSGSVTLDELMTGFDNMSEFKMRLFKFGIEKADLEFIFKCIDTDDSGDVTYMEFVDAMFRSQRQDTETQLMLLQISMKKMMNYMGSLMTHIGVQPDQRPSVKLSSPGAESKGLTVRDSSSPDFNSQTPTQMEKDEGLSMQGEVQPSNDADGSKALRDSASIVKAMENLQQSVDVNIEARLHRMAEVSLALTRDIQTLRSSLVNVQRSTFDAHHSLASAMLPYGDGCQQPELLTNSGGSSSQPKEATGAVLTIDNEIVPHPMMQDDSRLVEEDLGVLNEKRATLCCSMLGE